VYERHQWEAVRGPGCGPRSFEDHRAEPFLRARSSRCGEEPGGARGVVSGQRPGGSTSTTAPSGTATERSCTATSSSRKFAAASTRARASPWDAASAAIRPSTEGGNRFYDTACTAPADPQPSRAPSTDKLPPVRALTAVARGCPRLPASGDGRERRCPAASCYAIMGSRSTAPGQPAPIAARRRSTACAISRSASRSDGTFQSSTRARAIDRTARSTTSSRDSRASSVISRTYPTPEIQSHKREDAQTLVDPGRAGAGTDAGGAEPDSTRKKSKNWPHPCRTATPARSPGSPSRSSCSRLSARKDPRHLRCSPSTPSRRTSRSPTGPSRGPRSGGARRAAGRTRHRPLPVWSAASSTS
jgi:hypothetical protein